MDTHIKNSLSYLILQVSKAHRQQAQQALSAAGIYVGQEMILMQLWEEDGLALSQLIERACVQPATITKMLNRMEKTGLVSRQPDPTDKRAKRIYLTDAGRALQAQTCAAWQTLEARTTAALSSEEQATLHHLLTKVLDEIQNSEPILTDSPCELSRP